MNEDLLSRIQEDQTTGEITNDGEFRKWVPIGDWASSNTFYQGVFNGNDCTIKGIYINESDKVSQGFFGELEGAVLCLAVADSRICGNYRIGGIAGKNLGDIKKCIYRGEVVSKCTTSKMNGSFAGGIVGYNDVEGKIEECTNYGNVKGYVGRIGGIAGDTTGEITGCVNEGNVLSLCSVAVADTRTYGAVGGVAGSCAYYKGQQGNVIKCVNYGEVKLATNALSVFIGGIVGFNEGGKIDACWNDGEVNGGFNGGICGPLA